VAETHGNPLALLQLPRGLSPAQLAGGFGLPAATPLAGRIEESFLRELAALPAETLRLLQLAAADPTGDRALIWRAAGRLGIPVHAAALAEEAGLAAFAPGVRFRHPLVRSAAYRSAAIAVRQELHAALAEVTDPIADPDRRAWHRALVCSRCWRAAQDMKDWSCPGAHRGAIGHAISRVRREDLARENVDPVDNGPSGCAPARLKGPHSKCDRNFLTRVPLWLAAAVRGVRRMRLRRVTGFLRRESTARTRSRTQWRRTAPPG
jgi:hypothetical protein